MLHPVYRLVIDSQQRMSLGTVAARAWRPTVVVPREVCVFEQVPAAGVAWHERAGFARLQVMRLAPFLSTGGTAVFRGRTLMMWLWDAAEVDAALTKGGLDPARIVRVAETLMLPLAREDGAATLRCQGGTDHLVLDGGAIRSSRWQPDEALGRAPPDLLRGPWARDLLRADSILGAWDAARVQRALTMACWAAAFGLAAYGAYWAGQWQALETRIAAEEGRASEDSTDFGRLFQLKQAQTADRVWLEGYRRLSTGVRIEPLLVALQRPLELHSLTMKELELRDEDLRIIVVSAGGDIDLPKVLRALTALPGIESVQLRQSADTQQAAFTMRVSGFRAEIGGNP